MLAERVLQNDVVCDRIFQVIKHRDPSDAFRFGLVTKKLHRFHNSSYLAKLDQLTLTAGLQFSDEPPFNTADNMCYTLNGFRQQNPALALGAFHAIASSSFSNVTSLSLNTPDFFDVRSQRFLANVLGDIPAMSNLLHLYVWSNQISNVSEDHRLSKLPELWPQLQTLQIGFAHPPIEMLSLALVNWLQLQDMLKAKRRLDVTVLYRAELPRLLNDCVTRKLVSEVKARMPQVNVTGAVLAVGQSMIRVDKVEMCTG